MSILFESLLPIAKIEDWFRVIVFVVFVLIWIFNSLLSNKAKAKPRPQQRPQAPPRPDVPAGEQPARPQQLAGEIDNFLKRATQKRQEKSRRKQPAKAIVIPPPPAASKPSRRLTQSAADIAGFEVSSFGSVAEHVEKHLNTREFAERASQLVDEDIAKDDAEREAHLKEVFGHQVGRLADTSILPTARQLSDRAAAKAGTAGATAATAANTIAALLSNPENLKQAIVLNEILTRPEHRW